jgi:hypothetical protein
MVSFDNKVRDTPESLALRADIKAYKPKPSAIEAVKEILEVEDSTPE